MTKEERINFVLNKYNISRNFWSYDQIISAIEQGLDINLDIFISLYKFRDGILLISCVYLMDNYHCFYYNDELEMFDTFLTTKEKLNEYKFLIREKNINSILND